MDLASRRFYYSEIVALPINFSASRLIRILLYERSLEQSNGCRDSRAGVQILKRPTNNKKKKQV